MSQSSVLVSDSGGVLEITLNRPEARNAIDQEMADAVGAALDRLDRESDLRVGVLSGAGGVFCSGMDLKLFLSGRIAWVDGRGFAGITHRGSRKPLIAAVEGYALAGGFEIALSCDLIVAARGARFGIPEVKLGLLATGGGLARLARRVPYHLAMELALTGAPMDAARGAEMGVVNRLTEPGGALDEARDLARSIAQNAPLAVTASKTIVQGAGDWDEAESWERQSEIAAAIFASDDAREGPTAFIEKRDPVWTGG